ncbi:MAG: hypothetical protein ABW142_10785 [Thermoleophilaceae bacterium]
MGAIVFAAFAIGGNAGEGLFGFAVMAGLGLVFLIGGARSETLAGLGDPGRDEQWAFIDMRATAFSGLVVLLAILGAWLYEIADGRDGSPYGQLAAIGGIAYIVGVVIGRRRS